MKKNKQILVSQDPSKGFSLIEILVVISIFAVIGVLSTRALFQTLRGAKKSDSMVRVRENVNYAMAVIERQIRNSESVICPNTSPTLLEYTSIDGMASTFSCVNVGATGYIASGSGRLTSSDIAITTCTFECSQYDANNPPSVKVSLTAEDPISQSVEKGTVTIETEIGVRNY